LQNEYRYKKADPQGLCPRDQRERVLLENLCHSESEAERVGVQKPVAANLDSVRVKVTATVDIIMEGLD